MTLGWLVQNLSLRLILASSETIDPLTLHCRVHGGFQRANVHIDTDSTNLLSD
jgi:hypothetical protein